MYWPMSVLGCATQSGLHQFAIQAPEAPGDQLRLALRGAHLLAWHHFSASAGYPDLKKGGGPFGLGVLLQGVAHQQLRYSGKACDSELHEPLRLWGDASLWLRLFSLLASDTQQCEL